MEKKKHLIRAKIPTRMGFVELEGSPDDIRLVLNAMSKSPSMNSKKKTSEKTVKSLIIDLIEEGFFNEPRKLREVKSKLVLRGYTIDVTSLSPILHRDFVREGLLEKGGERGSYTYVLAKKILEQSTAQ